MTRDGKASAPRLLVSMSSSNGWSKPLGSLAMRRMAGCLPDPAAYRPGCGGHAQSAHQKQSPAFVSKVRLIRRNFLFFMLSLHQLFHTCSSYPRLSALGSRARADCIGPFKSVAGQALNEEVCPYFLPIQLSLPGDIGIGSGFDRVNVNDFDKTNSSQKRM
jgi:hypothetical protein